jgi:hypothetical protein
MEDERSSRRWRIEDGRWKIAILNPRLFLATDESLVEFVT